MGILLNCIELWRWMAKCSGCNHHAMVRTLAKYIYMTMLALYRVVIEPLVQRVSQAGIS